MRLSPALASFALVLALAGCGGGESSPDGTARPDDIQQQLTREATAATNCTEAQAVFDRFLAASKETQKGTDRSAQNVALTDMAYDRGTALGCTAFPK